MAAFDSDWWDARCLVGGKVDTCGVPFEGADHVAWIRWRLIDELLQRHFTDVGLEPGFGLMGTELYNVALYSPTCRRAPRYFGRLCGTDVHPEDDSDLVTGKLGDGKLTWAGAAEPEMLHGGSWDSWTSYLQDAIAALGLGTAGITGHEGCFHRRGKALTPLMYRIALLLRTEGGRARVVDDDRLLTLTSTGNPQLGDQGEALTAMIRSCGSEIPTGPPRFLATRTASNAWVALRTDGWIATRHGAIDAADLWRRGASFEDITDRAAR